MSIECRKPLEETSWEEISRISSLGLGPSFWKVGDTKSVVINGTVGPLNISGTYQCFIIGFDHNSDREGRGIHFQLGKTLDGADIAFADSSYGSYSTTTNGFRMNLSETNTGGWAGSYMRTTIIPQFKLALPSDLQAVIRNCTKYTDNVGGGTNIASNVTATTEDVFLLSEFEVQGKRIVANSTEQSYQMQYAYYAKGNSKIKYKHDDTASAIYCWTRSSKQNRPGYFCAVTVNGGPDYNISYFSFGITPAFVV